MTTGSPIAQIVEIGVGFTVVSIKSALDRLSEGLKRAPHEFKEALQTFPDLSIDTIAKQLSLAKRGQARGVRNEPGTKSTEFDEVEHAVSELIHGARKSAHQQAIDQIDLYDQRLNALDFEGRISAINDAAPLAVSEFGAEAKQGRDELYMLRRGVVENEDERAQFKKDNRIKRAPYVSSSATNIFKIGLLVFLFAFETYVNGVFLAKGNELGLIGGAVEALVFAVLNIVISFFIGLGGARYLNHRSAIKKLYGFASFIFWLGFVILLNLALAHYREISGSLYEDAGAKVITQLMQQPLGLQDIKSWLFLAIGLVFSMTAFLDGLFFSDRFPGYAALEKRVRSAHARYIHRKEDLIEGLKDILEEASETMDEARKDLGIRRGEHNSIIGGKNRLSRMFAEHQEHLERTGNALLTAYRSPNQEARSTPAPARFEQRWRLAPLQLDLQSAPINSNLDKQIEQAQELLTTQIHAIHQSFREAIEKYHQIDDFVPEDRNAAK